MMKRVVAPTIGLLLVLSVSAATSQQASRAVSQQTGSGTVVVNHEQPITVTIVTGGGLFGPSKDRFQIGEEIPVTITMTNTTNQPESTCITGPLYQTLPRLTKGGRLIPYTGWQSYELLKAEENKTCPDVSLPETVFLKPKESRVVDWLVLADYPQSADAWYEPLPPGDYHLSVERRFGCCDGPMVDSNEINFEVVP